GTNASRLANCAQTAGKSGEPPSLARVFSYSARRSASVQSRRAKPTMAYSEGRFPPRASWNSAGTSLRCARSPVAPKSTTAHGSGARVRGNAWRKGLISVGLAVGDIGNHPFPEDCRDGNYDEPEVRRRRPPPRYGFA